MTSKQFKKHAAALESAWFYSMREVTDTIAYDEAMDNLRHEFKQAREAREKMQRAIASRRKELRLQ